MNCVTTRELPSFAAYRESRRGPTQLKGRNKREFQMSPRAVGVDDPIQKLLAAGVDPALLLDRSHDQIALILLEFRIGAGPVHLRGGRENHPLVVFHALLDHIEIHLEIEVVDADRIFHIELRRGDRHQRQDDSRTS